MTASPSRVPVTLQTPRLHLTLLSRSNPAHYSYLLASLNNPTAYAKMGDFGIRTKEQLDALHTALHVKYPVAFDFDLVYIISLKAPDGEDESGEGIGNVTLGQRSRLIPPDVGWAMREEWMGNGYATEAAREFLRAMREDVGIEDICVWPDVKNPASNRVAEKLGFVEGGSVKVKEQGGKEVAIWILPSMKSVGKGEVEISVYGEGGNPNETSIKL